MNHKPFPPMPQDVYTAMLRRGGRAVSSGKKYDLHHSLLSKNDVRSMPDSEKIKIHSVYNLLWIPNSDHASHANVPSRAEAYKILCEREGKDNVDAWFRSFNFKVQPFSLESLQ